MRPIDPVVPAASVTVAGMLEATLAIGATPSVAPGVGLGVRLGHTPWRAAAALRWNRPIDDKVDGRADVSLALDRLSVDVRGCYGWEALGLCLVADAAALVGRAGGDARPLDSVLPTLSFGAGVEVVAAPHPRAQVRISVDLLLTAVGAAMVVERTLPDGSSAPEELWRSPVVAVLVGVAPMFQFR
jgi:hypothetical protein